MNRERLENLWFAIRPLLIYSILFITVQAIAFRLMESLLLALHVDMTVYYAGYRVIAEMLILAAAVTAGLLPVLRDGRREIRKMQAGRDSAVLSAHEDRRMLGILMPVGTVCLSLALNILLLSVGAMAGNSAGTYAVDEITAASLPMAAVVYGILTPLAEELVYRGIVFARLRAAFDLLPGAVISAFLFGLSHGNLRQGVYGFVMGMVFAVCYEASRVFAVPFLLHSLCNLTVLIMNFTDAFDLVDSPAWVTLFTLAASLCALYWYRCLYGKRR